MFQATDIKVNDVDFNPEFIKRMIPKLEWDVICDAAESVSDSELLIFSQWGFVKRSGSAVNWRTLIGLKPLCYRFKV